VSAVARPRPVERRFVPHARPDLGPEEEAAAHRVLRSARLAPGTEAARLEALLTRLSGCEAAVAVASGTLALTLALQALEIEADSDVVVPSYGCAALLHAVRAAGARPLVCDVDPGALTLDPADVARRVTPRTRAIVLVHPFGNPALIDPLLRFGVPVIEDCAQSPGARLDGTPVGSRGAAAIFSFGPTKMFTCGGPGGALASTAGVVRRARDRAGHDEKEDDRPRVNGLMGDLHAAIAVAQLGRLPEFVVRRRRMVAHYDEALAGESLRRPDLPEGAQPVFYRYLLRTAGDARDLIERLQSRGIEARHPVHRPLHRLTGGPPCPGADAAHEQWISLPLSPVLNHLDVGRVIEEVLRCRS
jgi:dTDP-4-amino-4,6-dideoxygalactose transaminase